MTPSQDQKIAIDDFEHNILLQARAGTGKTYTVANKIAKAINSKFCKPEEILCVTFTVKAAEEIKADIRRYVGKNSGATVNTIHGFCLSIIKEYGRLTGEFRDKSVADEVDTGEILKSIVSQYRAEEKYIPTDPTMILPEKNLSKIATDVKHHRDNLGYRYTQRGGFNHAIAQLLHKESFTDHFSIKKSGVKITDYALMRFFNDYGEEFFEDYQNILSASNLLDFDDLIFGAKDYLSQTDIFKNRYKLVIIDEMQDTSILEYNVMSYFFDGAKVMLCGDDAQTIYSWRGSSPEFVIDNFKKLGNVITVNLTENRRSTPALSHAGEYFITTELKHQIPKKPEKYPVGDLIDIIKFEDSYGEAKFIYDILKQHSSDPSKICVMARTNSYISNLYKKLEKLSQSEKTPPIFFTADKDYQFYKKPVIKDLLAFFRILVNKNDAVALDRISEKYISGVGVGTLRAIKEYGRIGISVDCFLRRDTYLSGDCYQSLITAFNENKIVVYDFETTGLDLSKDQAIQLSAIKLGKDFMGEEFNTFIIPTIPISEEAISTHGYDLEYIKKNGGVSAKTALERFSAYCNGCVLIGHNSSAFDDALLARQCSEEGVCLSIKSVYDTRILANLYHGDLKNFKLETLCEHFGIVNARAHDAFADVEATAKCLEKMIYSDILPTTDIRKKIISQMSRKYSKFYSSYCKMKEMLSKNNMFDLFKYIDATFGLLKVNSKDSDRESARDLYKILKDGFANPVNGLRDFLTNAALSGSQMDLLIKKLGKIPLITVHQSKGCEFDTVIIAGCDENEFPSIVSRQKGNDLEEEKRVFYVALSRAKKKLYITYSTMIQKGFDSHKRQQSPYLKSLPPYLLYWTF